MQRILDITGLVPVLPVLGDRDEAIEARAVERVSDMTGRPEVPHHAGAPEGVGVVRQALAGMADALDFDGAVLADMKMAVTEACNQRRRPRLRRRQGHARGRDARRPTTGSRSSCATRAPASSRARHRREPPALGLGLPLIAALSDSFELRGSPAAGPRCG